MAQSVKTTSFRNVNLELDSIHQIESQRRGAYALTTCSGPFEKILAGLVAGLLLGGIAAAVAIPMLLVKAPTTATTMTNPTTFLTTTTTSTTSTTSTTATTRTTTRRLPVSRTAIVTASGYDPGSSTPTTQQDNLVDRNLGSGGLNTGGYPPRYVQLEFLGFYNITFISLQVAQAPNGATTHQFSVGPTSGSLTLATTLKGVTSAGQWINITYNPSLVNVKFLRVDTTASPSWVAWVKFIVYDS